MAGIAFPPESGEAATAIVDVLPGRYVIRDATEQFLWAVGLSRDQLIDHTLDDAFPSAAAHQLEKAIERCRRASADSIAMDVNFAAPVELPMDVIVASGGEEDSFQVRVVETERTEAAAQKIIGRLFDPAVGTSRGMIYTHELKTGAFRTWRNNLSPALGLGNTFRMAELAKLIHPDDDSRGAEYRRRREQTRDDQRLAFEARLRAVPGGLRVIAGRGQVLERDPDGSIAKILGLMFDTTDFHGVNEALVAANQRLSRAEEGERARLGQELHDSTGQLLAGAQLLLDSVDPARLSAADRTKLDEVGAAISGALAEIRSLTFLLHPPDLQALGLAKALEGLCVGFGRRARLPIAFSAHGQVARRDSSVEIALFRVAQEALMNVHRHAHANQAEVHLREHHDSLLLEVLDDGVGIAGDGARSQSLELSGVGVWGMRARMLNVGGQVLLENRNPGLRVAAVVGSWPT